MLHPQETLLVQATCPTIFYLVGVLLRFFDPVKNNTITPTEEMLH